MGKGFSKGQLCNGLDTFSLSLKMVMKPLIVVKAHNKYKKNVAFKLHNCLCKILSEGDTNRCDIIFIVKEFKIQFG